MDPDQSRCLTFTNKAKKYESFLFDYVKITADHLHTLLTVFHNHVNSQCLRHFEPAFKLKLPHEINLDRLSAE